MKGSKEKKRKNIAKRMLGGLDQRGYIAKKERRIG